MISHKAIYLFPDGPEPHTTCCTSTVSRHAAPPPTRSLIVTSIRRPLRAERGLHSLSSVFTVDFTVDSTVDSTVIITSTQLNNLKGSFKSINLMF